MKNYYEIIGVSENSDLSTIKKEYLIKIKQYHPDVFEGDKVFAEEKTAEINEAYNILKDPELRKDYDTKLQLFHQQNAEQNVQQHSVEEDNNIIKDIGDKIKSFFGGLKKDLSDFNNRHKKAKIQKKKKAKTINKEHKEDNKEENKNIIDDELTLEKKDNIKQKVIIWVLIFLVVVLIFLSSYIF